MTWKHEIRIQNVFFTGRTEIIMSSAGFSFDVKLKATCFKILAVYFQFLCSLILDEADRCLDMGFAETMNAILQNLPTEDRQTLLFSATQTR